MRKSDRLPTPPARFRVPRLLSQRAASSLILAAGFALRAETARLGDLPPALQARLKAVAAATSGAAPGLHAAGESGGYRYTAPGGSRAPAQSAPAPFTATLAGELPGSLEVTAGGTEFPVRLIPLLPGLGRAARSGDTLSYATADGTRLVYTFKRNGVKEDIVLAHAPAGELALRWLVKLDPALEAKLDGRGNLLVYGPDALLSGFIQTGDERSAGLLLKARQRAPKNRLLYVIPAPVVLDGAGHRHADLASYAFADGILTLRARGLAPLPAPVTIDPSVVVTTTADFAAGNNEGMISFDTDAISRGVQTGGSIGPWTATTNLARYRAFHASVAYNGYLYVIGGNGAGTYNDVQYAPINGNGTIGAWASTAGFATARTNHTSVAYNGYLYIIGGIDSGGVRLDDVQYAPINADGTVGTWNATTSFVNARYLHTSVAYNDYLYVIGGYSGAALNDVQYAPINANGTVGTWNATTSFVTARSGHASVAYNGYLYVIGGTDGVAELNNVQYAPINSNGTVGTWNATASLTTARRLHASLAYNGYLYVIGGYGGGVRNDVQYAPINANGTVGPWNATALFATGRYGHTAAAFNGVLYVMGGWNGTVPLNDVQIAPINAKGPTGSWNATTPFVTARYGHSSVAYNGYLYVVGGTISGSSGLNDVQYAPINADGTVGTWNTTNSFPTGRMYHTAVAYAGYLYVIGGYILSPPFYLNDIQVAPINADGSVGAWSATTPLVSGRSDHTSVAYNGYLYVIGGIVGAYTNDVQVAPINAGGSLGAWSTTTSFPTPRENHTSVAYNGFLYVIGGADNTPSVLSDVQFAPINANGTIGAWAATTSFATARSGHTSVASGGYLYVIGGYNSTYLNDVQYAPINSNGTVGAWRAASSLGTARRYHTSVVSNGTLYVIGGDSFGSLNDVQYTPINANGTVGAWTATTSFATGRYGHCSVAYNGYLYVIGGQGAGYYSDVQYAPINGNGTVGVWAGTVAFNTARYAHTAVAYNGFLYVIGGFNGSYLSDVQYAPIHPDGTVGAWTATTGFATARGFHTSVVYNGFMYVIGGNYSGGYTNNVQYAPINPDGTVGSWTATTPFATGRYGHTSTVYNGTLYVIGGYDSGGIFFSDVQYAPINPNGTVGAWNGTNSFGLAREFHSSVAYNGYLYVIGGYGGTYLNDVEYAPINGNGTVGGWSATTSFTTVRAFHASLAYNGYLYVIGGWNAGVLLSDVQVTGFNGPAARAAYSRLTDLGADRLVSSLQFTGTAGTRGRTNLSYMAAAASNNLFGPRVNVPGAASGTPYTFGLGCSRYLWTRFDLDDTNAATIDSGGTLGRKDLLDLTVTYNPFAGPGNTLLGGKSAGVHLSWPAAAGALSYNLKRCTMAGAPCTPAVVTTTAGLIWDDPVLADANSYWYAIESVNGACVGQ